MYKVGDKIKRKIARYLHVVPKSQGTPNMSVWSITWLSKWDHNCFPLYFL